ncbi:MAG: hypothetical protein CSA95_06880 [Bacteroidetes bacterium]|nr:MAG: hypothetical protein CSA95_06880 [Bacteroidota bacterium]PIE88522.1 MAG: hypothetical protein CSA04_01605 [Bacteroidota bacterium]
MKIYLLLLSMIGLYACHKEDHTAPPDYPEEMRQLVINISHYAKKRIPHFIVIPQNGVRLVSTELEPHGTPHIDYLSAIDGNGQEDLWYGFHHDDEETPAHETSYLQSFLTILTEGEKTILVTDYCSTPSKIERAYALNEEAGYLSFVATQRALNNIPHLPSPIHRENNMEVSTLSQAQNFLYLINPASFSSKEAFIHAITSTNYDLLIMDLFLGEEAFTAQEIAQLRAKANGGKRLVLCYLSIGEAEEYRYYWKANWLTSPPAWLGEENPNWPGNYLVRYWDPKWQKILYGSDQAYLDKIIKAHFDGVYLDLIDAFEYYEAATQP